MTQLTAFSTPLESRRTAEMHHNLHILFPKLEHLVTGLNYDISSLMKLTNLKSLEIISYPNRETPVLNDTKNLLTTLNALKVDVRKGWPLPGKLSDLTNLTDLKIISSRSRVKYKVGDELTKLTNLARLNYYNCVGIMQKDFQNMTKLTFINDLEVNSNGNRNSFIDYKFPLSKEKG